MSLRSLATVWLDISVVIGLEGAKIVLLEILTCHAAFKTGSTYYTAAGKSFLLTIPAQRLYLIKQLIAYFT